MNLPAHLSTLYTKKAQLEDEIAYEQKSPLPNFLKISELKKQKMILKQLITQFSASGEPVTA
jgi:hypothetical protein